MFRLAKVPSGWALSKKKVIAKWKNDHFDKTFDIYNEKNWIKFITEYRDSNGQSLRRHDKNGDIVMIAVGIFGMTKEIRAKFYEITGDESYAPDRHNNVGWLFPLRSRMQPPNFAEPMHSYNKKYIWPVIPE